jgi:D-lactate dehydrogenase (cytochrome)
VTDIVTALRARFGERVTDAPAAREAHGRSESHHAPHLPDAVVFPEDTAEVIDLVNICRAARVPLTAFGAGTSLGTRAI